MNISIIIIIKNYKKPSLDQGISRLSFIIPTYRFLSCPSSTSLTLYWYYLEEILFLPQYTTPIWNNQFIHFLILLEVLIVSPTSPVIKKRNYVLIPPLSTVFNFSDHLTYLLSYNRHPYFSISMPSNHSGPSFTGNYYDIAGRQSNTTINGPVNGRYLSFYCSCTLINEWYIHSTNQCL